MKGAHSACNFVQLLVVGDWGTLLLSRAYLRWRMSGLTKTPVRAFQVILDARDRLMFWAVPIIAEPLPAPENAKVGGWWSVMYDLAENLETVKFSEIPPYW